VKRNYSQRPERALPVPFWECLRTAERQIGGTRGVQEMPTTCRHSPQQLAAGTGNQAVRPLLIRMLWGCRGESCDPRLAGPESGIRTSVRF